jgi:hypothetical protein
MAFAIPGFNFRGQPSQEVPCRIGLNTAPALGHEVMSVVVDGVVPELPAPRDESVARHDTGGMLAHLTPDQKRRLYGKAIWGARR